MQRQIDQLSREIERLKRVEKFPTIPNAAYTPNLVFGGANVGMTYTARNGFYTKVGNAIIVTGYIVLSAKGSSTGNAAVTLPVAAGSLYQGYLHSFWSLPGTYVHIGLLTAFGGQSANVFGLTAAGTAPVQLTDAAFGNTSQLRFSGVYFV
jgi:hypothetical protein